MSRNLKEMREGRCKSMKKEKVKEECPSFFADKPLLQLAQPVKR
jgi:hypothetical protein